MDKEFKVEDCVELGRLRRILDKFINEPDETKITFEFVMAALFPSIFSNVQNTINQAYTAGYIQATLENENKTEN